MRRIIYLFSILGLFTLTSCQVGTISPSAKQYAVESDAFSGEMTVHQGPGMKDMFNVWDDVSYYDKVGSFDFEKEPIEIRFANNNIAYLAGNINYRLPTGSGDSLMVDIEEEYEGEKRVKAELIRNAIEKAAFNTGQFMTVFDALGKRRSDLQELVFDQANNGQYQVQFGEEKIKDIATGEYVVTKVSKEIPCKADSITGRLPVGCIAGYLRTEESALRLYGIELFNFTVKSLRGEDKVEKAIAANLERSNRMEELGIEAREAQVNAATIVENSKADIATEEAAAAVAVAQAKKATAVAKEQAVQRKVSADALLYEKEAQAKADALLVDAGLKPEVAAEWEYKTKVGVAEALSKRPVPSIVSGGGQGGQLENTHSMKEMILLMNLMNKSN